MYMVSLLHTSRHYLPLPPIPQLLSVCWLCLDCSLGWPLLFHPARHPAAEYTLFRIARYVALQLGPCLINCLLLVVVMAATNANATKKTLKQTAWHACQHRR